MARVAGWQERGTNTEALKLRPDRRKLPYRTAVGSIGVKNNKQLQVNKFPASGDYRGNPFYCTGILFGILKRNHWREPRP